MRGLEKSYMKRGQKTEGRTLQLPDQRGPEGRVGENVTPDMGHMTCDTWREVNILSKCQVPSSYGLKMKVS